MISAIRNGEKQIKIECCLFKFRKDAQWDLVAERCSLHQSWPGQKWALLTKAASESLLHSLSEQSTEVLNVPTVITTQGLDAIVHSEPLELHPFSGFDLSVTPFPIAESSVIRLSYTISESGPGSVRNNTVQKALVGSGQTLLLLIEKPADTSTSEPMKRFMVMLTPSAI